MDAAVSGREFRAHIRCVMPHLSTRTIEDLARALARLVDAFSPVRIYVYGSHARGAPHADSDLDLMVVVTRVDEPIYRLDQRGYAVLESIELPIELFFITRDDFEWRLPVAMSLPAAVVREGQLLYDAESGTARGSDRSTGVARSRG